VDPAAPEQYRVPSEPPARDHSVGAPTMNPDSASPRPAGPLSGPLGILLFIVFFTAAGYLAYRTLRNPPIPDAEPLPTEFLCIETNKPFEYAMQIGEKWPVKSPYSGKNTGYPVEKCYWTKDGKRKSEPTYVILNQHLGKKGDTICPDCGRLVIGHNPSPPESVPLAGAPTTRPAK
jgi:hypothetical protein